MAASDTRLPRILMLHGYAQSAKIFASKMSSIQKACRNVAELVFVDAPHLIEIPPEWRSPDEPSADEMDPAKLPRGWWITHEYNQPGERNTGMDLSLDFLADFIKTEGPFEAVWGFSQGAALATILDAILHSQGSLYSAFRDIAPFQYSILVSGLKCHDPSSSSFYALPIHNQPHVHVIGQADNIVPRPRSLELVGCYSSPRVEFHQGGHHTPSQARWRSFFKDFIATQGGLQGAVESPESDLTKSILEGKT